MSLLEKYPLENLCRSVGWKLYWVTTVDGEDGMWFDHYSYCASYCERRDLWCWCLSSCLASVFGFRPKDSGFFLNNDRNISGLNVPSVRVSYVLVSVRTAIVMHTKDVSKWYTLPRVEKYRVRDWGVYAIIGLDSFDRHSYHSHPHTTRGVQNGFSLPWTAACKVAMISTLQNTSLLLVRHITIVIHSLQCHLKFADLFTTTFQYWPIFHKSRLMSSWRVWLK